MKPRMSNREIDFLLNTMSLGKIYLEFGCGGSTVLACKSSLRKIYSVDTDKEWIIKCQSESDVAQRIASGDAKLYFLNIGPLKRWGKPATTDKRLVWVAYSAGIWSEMSQLPDIVFVDGRWRVACALQALLRCENDTKILVHDWDRRTQYHELLEFANIEDKAGQLVSLAPKPDRDRGLIAMRALERVSDYS